MNIRGIVCFDKTVFTDDNIPLNDKMISELSSHYTSVFWVCFYGLMVFSVDDSGVRYTPLDGRWLESEKQFFVPYWVNEDTWDSAVSCYNSIKSKRTFNVFI